MEPFNTQALFGRDAAAAQRLENKVKVQHLKHDRAMLEWQEAEQQCAAKKELAHQALIELHQAEERYTKFKTDSANWRSDSPESVRPFFRASSTRSRCRSSAASSARLPKSSERVSTENGMMRLQVAPVVRIHVES
eukprot:jgi/Chrzof1/2732/Cz11g27060.t1